MKKLISKSKRMCLDCVTAGGGGTKLLVHISLLVIFLCLGLSCKNPNSSANTGGDSGGGNDRHVSNLLSDTSLKVLKLNGINLYEDANREDDTGNWVIGLGAVENTVETALLEVAGINPKLKIKVIVNGKPISDLAKIPLREGNNGISIEIESEDGTKKRTITISLVRKGGPEKDTSLAWIDFEHFNTTTNKSILTKLAPLFKIDGEDFTYEHSQKLSNQKGDEFYLGLSPTDKEATVSVKLNDGAPIPDNNNWRKLDLRDGDNKIVVSVTSKDKSKETSYTITLLRWASDEENTEIEKLEWAKNSDTNFTSINTSNLEPIICEADVSEIKLKVTTKIPSSKVIISKQHSEQPDESSGQLAEKSFDIDEGDQIFYVNILAKSGRFESYPIKIIKKRSDTLLKSFSVKVGDEQIPVDFNPADSDINITLPEPTAASPLQLDYEAENSNATVEIQDADGKPVVLPLKSFTETLKIVVKDGGAERTYLLHFTKRQKTVPVEIKVFSAVGQSIVDGTEITAFESETGEQKGRAVTDANGAVTLNLESGKLYDFVAKKRCRAGSRVQNYYVEGRSGEQVQMIQRQAAVGEKTESPSVVSVSISYDGSESSAEELKTGSTIDGTKFGSLTKLFAKFKLPSRLFAEQHQGEGNYNVACNIGLPASELNHISYGDLTEIEPDAAGNYTVVLNIGNAGIPNGSDTLFITAYDVAENRVDYRLRLNFIAKTSYPSDATGAYIDNFYVNIQRFPRPLYTFSNPKNEVGTFGFQNHQGYETSYRSLFTFWVKDKYKYDLKISGYDLYRREYVEGMDIDKGWKLITRKLYPEPYRGYVPQASDGSDKNMKGRHWGNDSDNDLYENTIYQYKIVAFDGKNRIESPVATTKLFKSFNVRLVAPAENAVLDHTKLDEVEFVTKLSDASLWDAKQSDFFNFGVMVHEKISTTNVVYAAKMQYHFNASGDERLKIADRDSKTGTYYYRTLKELKTLTDNDGNYIVPGDLQVEDLIDFDKTTGKLTIKKAFLGIGYFNSFNRKTLSKVLERGVTYFWDMNDWGNDPRDWRASASASFVKEWEILDSKTGQPILNHGKSRARAGSNIAGSENALNGRLPFSVN
ncbi:MAG: dentilisin complex subunit PrcA [Treponemataceae bacterium]